ncbi:MAG TPA: hypothetical protein VF121_09490 [Thermoanaerobaculia bacterium]|nr:hypothetical protein [Thermoanaerobaculia bacterium]
MRRDEALGYTEVEVRSYLPTGWGLARTRSGAWDDKKRLWRATVIDNVEFDWPLEVSPDEAAEHGRIEALRLAMNRVYRERLG